VPDYHYELGKIDTSKSIAELEKLSHVNVCAHAADQDPAFSPRIRAVLPVLHNRETEHKMTATEINLGRVYDDEISATEG